MKTGYPIRDVAYATVQGILLFPVFSDFSCAQAPDPFSFYTEKTEDHCRINGRQSDFFPHCLVLRVIRRSYHIDNKGLQGPALSGKEVPTRIKNPFFAP
jgi:hypothetical protein